MKDLKNNNWIILDPLRNMYEMYANLTVMTFLNLKEKKRRKKEKFFKACMKFFMDVKNQGNSLPF